MTYLQALDFMYAQLPMYQRKGASAYKPGLDRILSLLDQLDHPQHAFPSIHVAGTNGKGSTSHMIASGLQAKGLKVALYTSPHYKDYRERIKVNGQLIPKRWVSRWIQKYQDLALTIQPSFFEWSVAMAFDYFRNQKVDIAVIETGLGGRLDSTNVLSPILSVITNIGYDHMHILGNTRALIATEKAGIIKKNTPVVIGERDSETKSVFKKIAKSNKAPLYWSKPKNVQFKKYANESSRLYRVKYLNNKFKLHLDAGGDYQDQNLSTALTALSRLPKKYRPSKKEVKLGFSNLQELTYYIGRYQLLNRSSPVILADAAHNKHGLESILKSLSHWDWKDTIIILGMVEDKNRSAIYSLLPKTAFYFFVKPDVPRGLSAAILAQESEQAGLTGNVYSSVSAALKSARSFHEIKHILITGSSFVVAEVV